MSRDRTMNKRDFLKKAGLATASAAAGATLAAPYVKAQSADQVAAADLCRTGALGARDQELDPVVQQGGERRDGDRALHRRPAGAARRAVPLRAGGHDRRRAERRRFRRRSGRRQGVRRLLPLRLPLFARRAGAVALARAEGDLGGGLRRDSRGDLALDRLLGSRATSARPSRSARSPICRACASTPSRPAASSWRSSASCRSRCLTRTWRLPSRPASSTASAGAASPRCTRSAGPTSTKYFLTNPLSGAWAGSYFVNTEKWNAVPEHLKQLLQLAIDSSHYYRLHWYWAGEARYRNEGKLELTSIPDADWKTIEDAAGPFWDEVAGTESAQRQGRRDPQEVQREHGEGRASVPLRLSSSERVCRFIGRPRSRGRQTRS